MLTEVKNQIKVVFLSTKYALEREMLNKVTFISNILFMILNNASFIIQWIILYSIKDNIRGYTLKNVLLGCITSSVDVSALGDIIYAYIMLFIYGISLKAFLLFTIFTISGGLVLTSIAIIFNSLSFFFF